MTKINLLHGDCLELMKDIPVCKGGSYELDNLQVLTWFENRAKCDMTDDEWQEFKLKTKTTSTYFV